MKHFLTAAAMVVTLTGAAMADPVHGMWQTVKDDNGNYGHINRHQLWLENLRHFGEVF